MGSGPLYETTKIISIHYILKQFYNKSVDNYFIIDKLKLIPLDLSDNKFRFIIVNNLLDFSSILDKLNFNIPHHITLGANACLHLLIVFLRQDPI